MPTSPDSDPSYGDNLFFADLLGGGDETPDYRDDALEDVVQAALDGAAVELHLPCSVTDRTNESAPAQAARHEVNVGIEGNTASTSRLSVGTVAVISKDGEPQAPRAGGRVDGRPPQRGGNRRARRNGMHADSASDQRARDIAPLAAAANSTTIHDDHTTEAQPEQAARQLDEATEVDGVNEPLPAAPSPAGLPLGKAEAVTADEAESELTQAGEQLMLDREGGEQSELIVPTEARDRNTTLISLADQLEHGERAESGVGLNDLQDALELVALRHHCSLAELSAQVSPSVAHGLITGAINVAEWRRREAAQFIDGNATLDLSKVAPEDLSKALAQAEVLLGEATVSTGDHEQAIREALGAKGTEALTYSIAQLLLNDPSLGALMAAEQMLPQYLNSLWIAGQATVKMQVAQQQPSEQLTAQSLFGQSQPQVSGSWLLTPAQIRERRDDVELGRQEVRHLINYLEVLRENAYTSSLSEAELDRRVDKLLGFGSDKEFMYYAERGETVRRDLRNKMGTDERLNALNSALLDRLGVNLDELIAASLRRTDRAAARLNRTEGLHADVFSVSFELDKLTDELGFISIIELRKRDEQRRALSRQSARPVTEAERSLVGHLNSRGQRAWNWATTRAGSLLRQASDRMSRGSNTTRRGAVSAVAAPASSQVRIQATGRPGNSGSRIRQGARPDASLARQPQATPAYAEAAVRDEVPAPVSPSSYTPAPIQPHDSSSHDDHAMSPGSSSPRRTSTRARLPDEEPLAQSGDRNPAPTPTAEAADSALTHPNGHPIVDEDDSWLNDQGATGQPTSVSTVDDTQQ